MGRLSRENPNLSIRKLYVLARLEKNDSQPRKVETERPTSTSARPPRKDRDKPLPPGRAGFKQMMAEALDNLGPSLEGVDD